jgi:hypothetical protein
MGAKQGKTNVLSRGFFRVGSFTIAIFNDRVEAPSVVRCLVRLISPTLIAFSRLTVLCSITTTNPNRPRRDIARNILAVPSRTSPADRHPPLKCASAPYACVQPLEAGCDRFCGTLDLSQIAIPQAKDVGAFKSADNRRSTEEIQKSPNSPSNSTRSEE